MTFDYDFHLFRVTDEGLSSTKKKKKNDEAKKLAQSAVNKTAKVANKTSKAVSAKGQSSVSKKSSMSNAQYQKTYGQPKTNTQRTQTVKRQPTSRLSSARSQQAAQRSSVPRTNTSTRNTADQSRRAGLSSQLNNSEINSLREQRQQKQEEIRNAQRKIQSSIAAKSIQDQQNKAANDAAKREAAFKKAQQEAVHKATSKEFIREHDIVGKTITDIVRGSSDRKNSVADPFIENITTKEERDKAIKDNREKYQTNHEDMQKTAAGRIISNAPERIITREKRILEETGAGLADMGDFLNTGKANPNGRLSQDMGNLLPDREESRKQAQKTYSELVKARDKNEQKLAAMTKDAKGFEKTYYSAEESGQGMLSDYIMSAATGGMWEIPLALRTYGGQRGKAEAEGATTTEDRLNAAKDSIIEVVTEKIGGFMGAAKLAPGKKLLGPLAGKIDSRLAKILEGKMSRDVMTGVSRWGRNIGEEYLEEVIANPAENYFENVIFRNRVQAEREAENDAYFAELGSSVNEYLIENPDEVERYIAELNSSETRNEFIENFKEGGMNDKQAADVADKMIDFMEAAAKNDTETMKQIKASLDDDLVGDVTKKVWDWNEQLETLASTALLMGVSGAPGAVSTVQQGMAIKNSPQGREKIMKALSKVAAFDGENSTKSQALLESMEKDGYEPTATQVYDIMTEESRVMAESRERQIAAQRVKAKGMEREDLRVSVAEENPDGSYSITGPVTAQKYMERYTDTLELLDAIDSSSYQSETGKAEAAAIATAVASYDAGTLSVADIAELTSDKPGARYVFQQMTGVDLNQYNVYKNGKLDVAASNIKMQEGLLAKSAQNYIESARAEQMYWNDSTRGQMADRLGKNFNSTGDIAIHDALESVDPRDQSKFMLMGNVAQEIYRYSFNTTDSWEDVKKKFGKMYKSLNMDALEGMYESAKQDKAEQETPYLNYEVKAGEALDSVMNGQSKPIIKGKFVNETPYNIETGEGRSLTESDRIVLASLAKGINANITMIDAQDKRLSYTDENGNTQYNNASVDLATGEILLSNAVDIGTAIHEITHIGARLASRYYRDLADFIFDKAYKHDPEKTMRILDAYRRTYADQNLSDAKLKEEVVSDLVAAFQNDPRFVRDISQENPSLVRRIINAIEDLLRSLRNILATGRIQDPAVQNSFLVEIGAYEDARRMWLRMYHEAQQNSAALGIAKWHEDSIRDNRTANARHTNVEQAEKESELFLRDSEGNGLTERQAQIIHDIGPDIRFSRATFLNDLAKGEYYAGLNNGTGGFAGLREIASGKEILIRTMQNNGFSENQSKAVVGFLTHMADYLDSDDLHMRYSFIGWDDLSNAEITVRRDKNDNIIGVAVSAMVANGEYPVNFDMTTICNKREGVMEVIQELTRRYDEDTGRTILNSIKLTDEKMWSINKALKAEGIDTACLGCFVEARRYYTNRFIDKIDDVWNSAVRDARKKLGLPEEEYFNFAKGRKVSGEDYNKISDLWTAYDESTEAKRSPAQRIKILMDEIVRNKEVNSPYLKLISAEDILTPEGIDGFKRISTKDRDMVKMIKSIYGTSAPKEILAFTPYNSEIALLPDKIKGKDAGAYLRSIGGTRVQSFSDFKMAHMFDHMQMVADEAARGFVNHGYSKVIAYPKLFGLTGRKINMSVMFDVLPASEWQAVLGCSEEAAKEVAKKYQGLQFVKELPEWYGVEGHEKNDNRPYIETEIEGVHGYLTYLVSDADYVNSVFDRLYQQNLAAGMDEVTARREANKAKPFEQSINYREAVALENQEGYKENVGIIAVAYGDEHLKMLLDDPNVRYVIPYHRSGLPVFIAQKTALDIARDYTDSQNTRKAKRGMWYEKDGQTKFNLKARYKNFKAEYEQQEHPDGSFPAIEFFKEISQLTFDNPVLTEEEINEKINEYVQTLPEDISEEEKNELIKKRRKKLKKKDTSLAGTGSFDVYKDLDKVSDIREISNAYLEHCINKNQVPIFYEFASHPNYYKMLFDFAVTDAEGNIYPQRPVRNVYPGLDIDAKVAAGEAITEEDYEEFYKVINEGLQTENAKNELRSNRLGKVLDEDLLSREGENSIIADSNIQHIVNGTPDYTNPKGIDVANSREVDLDDAYMQAVNSGNMKEAQRLVDEAAKRAGYNTPRLYHGTPSFGFTTFDLGRGENIIFATSNPLTAETYSGETSRTRISDAPEIDVDKLSGEELLKEAAKRWNKYNSYRLMTPEEKESALTDARLDVKMYASIASDFIDENKDAFNDEKLAIANRAVDALERLSTAWKDDEVDNAWNDFEDAIWDLKWADESIQLELSRAIQSGGSLLFAKNRISDFMYAGNIYKDKVFENTGYIFDNQLALELEADLHKGIYGLYGKGDNQLVIDANGSNWNQITPPDELNLYGPQRTRSIAEAAKAKGYDSVLFKNLKDNGGGTPYNGISDVYMFFNPSQVKSADPVTYAEDGSAIPLSERFDPTNNDIRYSRPTIDSEGNILTDGQMEYFKNSQARDEQGRLVPVYHTTNRGGFTIFDPSHSDDFRSLFFSDDWDVSQTYGDYANSRFYYFDINNVEDVRKYLDAYSPDRYFLTQEQFEQAGGWEADFVDFENVTNGEQSDIGDYLENPDGYIAVVGVPDYSPDNNNYADTWVMANTPEELVKELHNHFGWQRDNYTAGTQKGYYPCYLNLENPMIIDAHGQYWNEIAVGDLPIEEGTYFVAQPNVSGGLTLLLNGSRAVDVAKDEDEIANVLNEFFDIGEYAQEGFDIAHELLMQQSHRPGDIRFDTEDLYPFFAIEMHDTRGWAEIAAEQGYDGVIFHNIIDIGDQSDFDGLDEESTVYIAFSSNQVKDINNENPTENPDIRYSRTVDDEAIEQAMSRIAYDDAMDNSYELLAYYEQQISNVNPETFDVSKAFREEDVVRFLDSLKAEDAVPSADAVFEADRVRRAKSKEDFFNNINAKWNDRWTTEGEVLKISSVKRDITNLVKRTMANSNSDAQYRNEVVRKTLLDARFAYQLMKQDRTELASYLLYHSAQRMMDGLEFIRDDTAFKEYKEIRDFLRTYRIEVPDKYWEDPTFLDFRKEYYGRLRIAKGGEHGNIEDVYQDLADNWPHLFNESQREKTRKKAQDDDLLYHIGEVIDSNVTPFMEAYSSEEATSLAFEIADQLYEIIANGDRVVSLADSYKERFDAKTKAMKQRHYEAILRERKIREEGIQKERKKFREYKEKRKERSLHKQQFEGIKNKYDELTKRLLTNTKDQHIPEQYKKKLAELLKAFDFQTVGSKEREARTGHKAHNTIRLEAMRTALESIETNSQFFHINDSVTDIIMDLLGLDESSGNKQSIEGKTLDELSASELKKVNKLLGALLHEFNNYEKVRVGIKKQQAADIGHAQNNISLEHAKLFGEGNDYQNMIGWVDKILNLDEMTAAYLFKRIDPNKEGLALMYGEIRKSFDKYVRNQKQLNEWMEEIVGKYHNKGILWNKYGSGELTNWRSDNYAQNFQLENGHTIRLTIAQMMSVACLAERDQARNHMIGNGVVVAPVTFQAKMLSDIKKKVNKALPERLTDADIKNIVTALTPEQRQVANKLQELMATKMADWGNEASMNVIGIRLFEDPDYFPIRSDRGGLTKDLDPNQFEQAIRNFGFTKAVQPGAKNAIMIDDIFDVVTEHCNNMNLYNSYTEAINDFMKVYNYREARDEGEYTVEQALSHAFSQKAPTFIMQFMRDLNGNVSRRASGIEDAYNSMLGNAKKAAVFANLRVAAQQPTAITRAFAVINPKYLKGIRIGQGDMKEMFEHCPIALWKSWGYYDINMGKSIEDIMMNNGRWLEDKATDIYGKLDNVTWTAIWQMVKAEMKDTHPNVKEGTDEYWELCNDRMSEIVDLTQVVDSPLHRSHAMRDKGFLKKTATAFMAEPTLTLNMILDGWRSAREAWKRGDKTTAEKIKWRTIAVALLQAATVSSFAAIVDALRHKNPDKDDDDDRLLHLWWVNTLENFKGELKLWKKVYFVKDLASTLEGWDNANLALQGFQKFALGFRQWKGDPYARSNAAWYENMADGIGYMWGIPVKTVRTGLSNAMNSLGLKSPFIDSVKEHLDSMTLDNYSDGSENAGFIGGLLSDNSSGMFGKLLTTVAKEETDDHETETEDIPTRDSLPDNLTDEQKDDIIKAAEKRAGKTKSAEEQEKRDYDTMLYDAMKASAGYQGEEFNKKVWQSVSKGYKSYIEEGNYERIEMMRRVVEETGGDLDYFDKQVNETSKSALKKSLKAVSDMTEEEFYAQRSILGHLKQSGMSDEEISSYIYKSDARTDLQVAMRINDEDAIFEELTSLVNAGFTQADFEKAFKNRNRVNLKNYKDKGGKYADKLKSVGTFIWPVTGPITSHFGYRDDVSSVGGSKDHPAIDIGIPIGTPVAAADGGVVIYAGKNSGYGNSVGIKHDNGMVTYYNHLDSWNVKVGDTVAQGQQIACSGNTGRSTGPHLDFKILDANGDPVDPEQYLGNKRS